MANSSIVVVTAVMGETGSKPFRMYLREGYEMPSNLTALRLDNGVDRNGNEVVTISNSNVGLIASHSVEYVEEVLKGFRAKIDGKVFINAKLFKDDIAPSSAIAKAKEVF